jgi:hypothetical protein
LEVLTAVKIIELHIKSCDPMYPLQGFSRGKTCLALTFSSNGYSNFWSHWKAGGCPAGGRGRGKGRWRGYIFSRFYVYGKDKANVDYQEKLLKHSYEK